jgi:hypothetical protein
MLNCNLLSNSITVTAENVATLTGEVQRFTEALNKNILDACINSKPTATKQTAQTDRLTEGGERELRSGGAVLV